ncbi:YidH family protein [Bdellovibrio sp. HCB337]|uniref:YidH family protein n=1 Tax=Bdellovibrio sp. HCB337 TaxID=3394358 RepID=UPI0039A40DAE
MSEHRTEMSDERTGFSELRTDLSEKRTEMSTERTDLSEHRTVLSTARSHLANERTHLAYLRTGIALISFGVTLNRFSLFLIQSNEMSRFGGRSLLHDTKNVGIGMVILGCVMLIWSVVRFNRTAREIDTLTFKRANLSVILFTAAIITVGVFSTIWMITG